jgi:hypothetical protein
MDEEGVVDFAEESDEEDEEDVDVESDDPDFVEESEAAGLLSLLLSAAGADLLSEESVSDELDADLDA